MKNCNLLYAEIRILVNNGSLKIGICDSEFDLKYRHSVGHNAASLNYGICADGSIYKQNNPENVKLHDISTTSPLGLLLERQEDGTIKFSIFVCRTFQTQFIIQQKDINDDLFIACSIGSTNSKVQIISAIVK